MKCPSGCLGGWLVVERNGLSAAEPCPTCGKPAPRKQTAPAPEECDKAVAVLSLIIPFFPKDKPTLNFISGQVREMVNTPEELGWLVRTATAVITDWRGPAQLRGIYCGGGYHPRDGIYVGSNIPGFAAPVDSAESGYFEREAQETDRRLAEYRREAKRLGSEPPPPLPPPKRMQPPAPDKGPFREVSYIDGSGITIQREEQPTTAELEAEIAKVPPPNPDEVARKAALLESELKLKLKLKQG